MSAIYGIIDLNGNSIRKEAVNDFATGYSTCKIDRHEYKEIKNALIGCELQYYNKEAKSEILPILDEKNHLFFTADCVLDNRESLLAELNIDDNDTPDGTLMYKAFLKWGKDCNSHFRGTYSYVAYNYETNEVVLGVDQFVTRCLFYHIRDNVLYFSTLLMPMVKASGLKYELNQRWLFDSISVLSPALSFEPIETAYKNVYKIKAGCNVLIHKNEKPRSISYYNPVKNIKTNYKMTDEECKEKLQRIFGDAVKGCLRTDGEVGTQLSAGLDSTSVASLAAPMLQEKGRTLYSFTSVPLKESTHQKDNYHLDDETDGVMNMVNAFPNIVPEFIECRGKNILNQGKNIVDIWELPCQSQQNAVWISEIYTSAFEKNCKILLCGATGNCSISAGGILDLFMDEIRRFHFKKAWKDLSHFCRRYGIHKKKFLKSIFKSYLEALAVRYTPYTPDMYQHVLSRKDLGQKLKFKHRIIKKELFPNPWISYKTARSFLYLEKAFSQIGEIDTKNTLQYGVLIRDPMRNVEFIDFLMSLPMEFFVNKNYERRLVREFMEGVVPESIRLDIMHRGRQSADNAYRISLDWDYYKEKLGEALYSETSKEYFDFERIHNKFDKLNKDTLEENALDTRICIDSYLFLYYVEKLKQYC